MRPLPHSENIIRRANARLLHAILLKWPILFSRNARWELLRERLCMSLLPRQKKRHETNRLSCAQIKMWFIYGLPLQFCADVERLCVIQFSDERARRRRREDSPEQQLQEDHVQCAGADRLLKRTDAINIPFVYVK